VPTDLLLTARTRETRDRLLRVARHVFEEDGFDGASVSRIVEEAGVSRGTFYLYFESKQDIFRTLAETVLTQVVELQRPAEQTDPVDTIRRTIAAFVVYYRRHARLMAVLEQVATHDESFRTVRREMRRGVAERAVRFVAALQRRGVVPATVDPRYAATALTGMVDRFCYVWLVLEEDFDEPDVVENLTTLWFQAIGGTMVDRERHA
jgi:AcrR family transcriptional regulator